MNNVPEKAQRKWLVLISVGMGVFLATIDGSIVNIGLNTFVQEFQQPLAVIEWVVLAYMLVICTLLITVGRLSDMIGKKKIFLFGMLIFTIGSGLCGISSTVFWLIGSRVFQAIGGAMTMAVGTALVTVAFPPTERGKALGIMGTLVSLGIITGPTIGGVILESLSWHWLFIVNLPVGVVGMIMVLVFVPQDSKGIKQKFDFLGAGVLFLCLSSFLFALSIGQNQGFSNWIVISLFAISILTLILFIYIEKRTEIPMIELKMFNNVQFSINLITGFLVFICTAGTNLLWPLFLQNVLHFGPQETGLLIAATPACVAFVAPLAGMLSDRTGSRPITTLGLSVLIIGFVCLSSLTESTSTVGILIRFIPVGIGIGLFQSPNNSAVMGSADRDKLGVASGLLSLTRTIGQTTGIALLGAFWENRVADYSKGLVYQDVTNAPAIYQVFGLKDTVQLVIVLLIVSFSISLVALIQHFRKNNQSLNKIS